MIKRTKALQNISNKLLFFLPEIYLPFQNGREHLLQGYYWFVKVSLFVNFS